MGRATGDIGTISLTLYRWQLNTGSFPATLAAAGVALNDPWGQPYEYVPVEGTTFRTYCAKTTTSTRSTPTSTCTASDPTARPKAADCANLARRHHPRQRRRLYRRRGELLNARRTVCASGDSCSRAASRGACLACSSSRACCRCWVLLARDESCRCCARGASVRAPGHPEPQLRTSHARQARLGRRGTWRSGLVGAPRARPSRRRCRQRDGRRRRAGVARRLARLSRRHRDRSRQANAGGRYRRRRAAKS